MKKLLISLIVFSIITTVTGQQIDTKLQKNVQEIIKGFNGDIGIYIKNLKTGKTVSINADTIFPTASIVKISILMGIMDKIRQGTYTYDSTLTYNYSDSLLYPGEDVQGEFKDGGKIRLSKVIMLMLTLSDNTASLWLQKLSGTGIRINQILDSMGYKNTRVNSRTPGREIYRSQYGWGQTTPREIAQIMEQVYNGKVYSPAYSERMMRCLGRNYWDYNAALSQIPPTVAVFSKNGAVDETRNEILLVNAPHQPYILSIFTKNNKDTSWEYTNEAWAITRKISSFLWHYFEPKDHWKKPEKPIPY